MARRRNRGLMTAPPRNDVYIGMLLLTVIALAIGTTLLALECNEYDWIAEPSAGPQIAIPQVPIGPRPASAPAAENPL
jgi:hypothetical protein